MNASVASAVKRFEETERRWVSAPLLQLDFLLLSATLALIAAGVYVVGTATRDDIPGSPDYYLTP